MERLEVAALFLFFAAGGVCQEYTVRRFAGGAPLARPAADWDLSVTADFAGNQFFAVQHTVFKRDPAGNWTRVAGTSRPGYEGDWGPAVEAQLNRPWGVAADRNGNLFIADMGNFRVRKVSADGTITTVAGNGQPASSGDGGSALAAGMTPVSVAVDARGNLYIGDSVFDILIQDDCCALAGGAANRVRKVSPDGVITTIAGGGRDRSGNGLATDASIGGPVEIAADSEGNVYIADAMYGMVRKVSTDGTIAVLAGGGRNLLLSSGSCTAGSAGNGGPGIGAKLCMPFGVDVDEAGDVFFAEFGYRGFYDIEDPIISNFVVRRVSPDGTLTTVPGSGTPGLSDRCNCADVGRGSVGIGRRGDLYFSDSFRTRQIAPDGSVISLLEDQSARFTGDGGPAPAAELNAPGALATDRQGNLYIADRFNYRIRKVTRDGTITTVAGTGEASDGGDGGQAIFASFQDISGIAVDEAGNLFVSDRQANRVRRVSPDGVITTVVGGGRSAVTNGALATDVELSDTGALAVDGQGNLYVSLGSRVLEVTAEGRVQVVTGPEAFFYASALAVDAAGNLFFLDRSSRTIRQASNGVIRTIAGGGKDPYVDGGPATAVDLASPQSLAADRAGNLWIAGGLRIRKVSPDGIVTTIAGGSCCSYDPDEGPATSVAILTTDGMAVDDIGNIYISESPLNGVRVVRPVPSRLPRPR